MTPKLMAIMAHPDDESFAVGGTLAKYASEGVDVFVLTATRGDSGRFRGLPPGDPNHPGSAALASIREAELQAAASVLGLREVTLLDYRDKLLDTLDAGAVAARIASHVRRVRPHVVLTFGPDGTYGHPDHIAISQFATAAIVAAADPAQVIDGQPTHAVSKLYYTAWSEAAWEAHRTAFKRWVSVVDGVERKAPPWPDWAITSVIDARPFWSIAWRAVSCHQSQFAAYEHVKDLPSTHHEVLWGWQSFYRVFSLVNSGRGRETDLFEGLK